MVRCNRKYWGSTYVYYKVLPSSTFNSQYNNISVLPQLGEKNMCSSVSLLPRKDILLFGSYPKMDVRVICQCEKCSKVMMPSAFVTHSREKHGPDQVHSELIIPPGTSLLKKNKYSHSKNKKKTILPPPVPPPPLFPVSVHSGLFCLFFYF